MMDVGAIRRQVQGILMRFPGCQATIRRPNVNAYGESTGESEPLMTVTLYWAQPSRPNAVDMNERGTTYQMDDRKWACLIWDEALENVRRGDLVICEGRTWRIRNCEIRLQVRVFWQLEEVSS